MKKREATFQSKFNRFLKHKFLKENGGRSFVFELKHANGAPLPYSAVLPHQRDALKAAKNGGLVYKIPDDSRGYKPFDCFALSSIEAYVVILYRHTFYMIDIDRFLVKEMLSKQKSLSEEDAKNSAVYEFTFAHRSSAKKS